MPEKKLQEIEKNKEVAPMYLNVPDLLLPGRGLLLPAPPLPPPARLQPSLVRGAWTKGQETHQHKLALLTPYVFGI